MTKHLTLTAPEGVWLGSYASWHRLVHALKRIDELSPEQLKALAFDWGETEEDEEAPGHWMLTRQGDLAFIQIAGSLTSEENPWFRFFGITSYSDIREAVHTAIEGGAKQGVLVFNSPGGSVSGVSETAAFLRTASNGPLPLNAYTGTQMTSAAYWLASGMKQIVAAPLATVGSIGAIGVHTEYTKLLEDIGITAQVFRAGKYKALANPYEKLSGLGAEEIQADLDFAYAAFTEQVADFRSIPVAFLRREAAEGKAFYAEQALPLGLIDRIEGLEGLAQRLSSDLANQGEHTMSLKTQSAAAGKPRAAGPSAQSRPSKSLYWPSPRAAGPSAQAGDEDPAVEEMEEEEIQDEEEERQGEEAPDTAAENPHGNEALLWSQVETLQAQLVDAKVGAREFARQAEQRQAEVNALTPLLVVATNRLEVGLGRPEVDLSTLSPLALVERFKVADAEFRAAFPVGGQFVSRTEADSPQSDTLEAAAIDPRVVNLSRFKR